MAGQAHFMVTAIMHGVFWKQGGDGARYLAKRKPLRDRAGDLTTAIADETARVMQGIMGTPALREEYARIDVLDDYDDDEDLRPFKALLIAFGLLP